MIFYLCVYKGGEAVQNIIMILLKGVHQRKKLDRDDIEK